jgi:C4-dicarboxylate transporter DctQ subunit
LYTRLLNGLAVLSGVMILFAMVIITVDVTLRGLLNTSLQWSFEVTEFILLYAPFLAIGWLARRRGHIVVDVAISQLSPQNRRWLAIAVALLVGAICLFLTYWGVIATVNAYNRGIVNAGLVAWPRWALLIVIPLGFGLSAVEFFRMAAIDARARS